MSKTGFHQYRGWAVVTAEDTADLIFILRTGYIASALSIAVIFLSPPLRSRFLVYGARGPSSSNRHAAVEKEQRPRKQDQAQKIAGSTTLPAWVLDQLAILQVPHSWFTSFYVVSVACSLFWGGELWRRGPMFRFVIEHTHSSTARMSIPQLLVAWMLLLVQGSRRLYESLALSKPSRSKMWIGHWILGVAFYMATNIAVWIEGVVILQAHTFSTLDIAFAAPGLRSFIAILVFILASGFQYDCHAYLASLKTTSSGGKADSTSEGYKVPSHPAFGSLVAPHYTAECLIYLALAILAAPGGTWLNWTLVCALIFVSTNLGVTATLTKQWYEEKFGAVAVANKYRMVPGLW